VGDDERTRALHALAAEFKITWGPHLLQVSVYSLPLLAVIVWVVGRSPLDVYS
jgi:hypothetical protein